jgi:hypothetical protein
MSFTDTYVAWRRKRPPGQPYDISVITEHLFIASWPLAADVPLILEKGIRLVISMFWGIQPTALEQPPLRLVQYFAIDSPLTPIPIPMLARGVAQALPVIDQGQGVLVHCRRGRHRSVAMACSILIALGHTSEQAMKWVMERRPVADPYAFYIRSRIEKFERYWAERGPAGDIARGPEV